jgi:hypothetical protein
VALELAWLSDRHGTARILMLRKYIRRSSLTRRYAIWPSPGHGSYHVRRFGAPSGLLILHALYKYGELHTRTNAHTPLDGALLACYLLVVRRGLVTLCICTSTSTCIERAASPRCISVHFRVSCLDVHVCFFARPQRTCSATNISISSPSTHIASVFLELSRKSLLSFFYFFHLSISLSILLLPLGEPAEHYLLVAACLHTVCCCSAALPPILITSTTALALYLYKRPLHHPRTHSHSIAGDSC